MNRIVRAPDTSAKRETSLHRGRGGNRERYVSPYFSKDDFSFSIPRYARFARLPAPNPACFAVAIASLDSFVLNNREAVNRLNKSIVGNNVLIITEHSLSQALPWAREFTSPEMPPFQ